jgi:CubicO group peptidase (beta-lactamase class C family)
VRAFVPIGLAIAEALASCSQSSSPASPPAADASPAVDAAVTDAPTIPNFDWSAVEQELFGGTWKTEGVVIQYQGQVVYEKYANGYTSSMRHIIYSASKSIGSALVGIAVNDGLMKLTDSFCMYVTPPTGADPKICDTTIEQLLQMTSGIAWQETYATDPTTSNVDQMIYGSQPDMGAYAASLPRAQPAGTVWNYSSGDANLLSDALRNALKGQDMRAYAKSKLFDPAGMTTPICEADTAGTLVFSSFCYVSPRDMARFMQLYLDDGMSGTTRVLPAGWVKYTITPAPPVSTPTTNYPEAGPGNTGGSYGASFWLNATSPSAPSSTFEYPAAPADAFSAEGHYGQKFFDVPSRHLVISRVGNDRDPEFDPGAMVAKAVAAIDKGGM